VTDAIREWIEAFPARDASARLDSLQRQAAEIDAEMQRLRQIMATFGAQTNGAPRQAVHTNGGRPTGMAAVERLLRERGGVWSRRDLNAALVERGWLAAGEAGRKTLGSILHRMVQRDRIVRVSEGRYRLPQSDQQEVLAA
jgi:hypothetical protein